MLDHTQQKPPRHPQFESSNDQKKLQKRYKQEEGNINKVSLPSLPNIKKMEYEMLPRVNMDSNKQQLQSVNYGNGLRIPSRLPKLEAKSEVPKYRSTDPVNRHQDNENHPNYQSVTPERNQQSPSERQLSLNKKRLLAKTCSLGQFSQKSKPGCLPNKTSKTNQDSAIAFPQSLEQMGYSLLGVCDGHGVNGHLVSNYIRQALPKHLEIELKDDNIPTALLKSFAQTNKEICDSEVDTALSGSTTVVLLIKKQELWTANVGDSRAIMLRCSNGRWSVVELTRDHKPSDEDEKRRIEEAGGRVECQRDYYGNPIGPERVWLSYCDAPGLAMTRSMGDKIGAQAGVISEPEIQQYQITEEDRCLIVGSDGVWDFMTNDEVMAVVVPYLEKDNIDLAADRLIAESIAAWKKHSLARDDITCVMLHIKCHF